MNDEQIFEIIRSLIFEKKSSVEPHIMAWMHNYNWSSTNSCRWSALYMRSSIRNRWQERGPDYALRALLVAG